MIITRLTLYNFGVYAGLNTFVFENQKPVVLIGGMNGRGKTTFLEAVLLALYGANSFAYHESRYRTYGQYLKSFVNKYDGSLISYVELEFKLEDNTKERYLVRREWSAAKQKTRERVFVYKNGEINAFLTDNWSMFMENILPSGLSNFFFFDGEKIAKIAVENTNTQMKESIKTLLGISVLDMLSNDLERIITKITKESGKQDETEELERLRKQKRDSIDALKETEDSITELLQKKELLSKKLETANLEYTSKGGDIVNQRQDLLKQRNQYIVNINQGNETLINITAGELPLFLVSDLLKEIQLQVKKEHETKKLSFAVNKVNSIFKDYIEYQRLEDTAQIQSFINYVEEKAEKESTKIIYDISETSLYQLDSLLKSDLTKVKEYAANIMKSCNAWQHKVDEIDSYLSVDIDEVALARIYKKIKKIEQEIIELEVTIEGEQKKRSGLHGEAIRASAQYNNFIEQYLAKLELNDDNERILKYSHYAIKILHEYKVRLQKRKINVLAETMTNCYKKLANKKNLIDNVLIDPVTLDFQYINADDIVVPKESLSAGEKQLMVISLLWALAKCSKKKLPVIIDTPLSRMDSNHRISLITTYFPQASDQTIILSTDSEIDKHYYDIMKDNVGDEFTLVYNDVMKCSTIKKGYFVGEFHDY
ncbi:MAG: DNA sulfur modification protein DndD [Butyrivibrio sp.]|nr:DNA sulfur modification protein DndD [Butyrivibrio sp.]